MKPLIGYQYHVLKGSKNRNSKLTESIVREIKLALRDNENTQAIADRFGIARSTVQGIAAGHRWSQVRI